MTSLHTWVAITDEKNVYHPQEQGLKCSSEGGGYPNFFTLRLCNKIMMAIRETRVKHETCCNVFYIVCRKFLTVTNYYKVSNVFIT